MYGEGFDLTVYQVILEVLFLFWVAVLRRDL